MIVLMTGVSGFIGSEIAKVLSKEKDFQIIGVGRSNISKGNELQQYYQCDITNESDIDELINKVPKCDVVVHLAAEISFNNFDTNLINVNCNGTLQIARFALATGVKQIVYISSVPIIGRQQVVPITEDNNSANPQTLYHLTKYMGELILQLPEFNRIKTCILRIPAPISPSMPRNRMFPLFLSSALQGRAIILHGKGLRVQNYVDTRDIGKAVLSAIYHQALGLYLIDGESMSNKEVALLCNELCNSNGRIEYSGKSDDEEENKWIISNQKSKNELHYSPQYRIKDVLTEMKQLLEKGN